MLIELLRFVRGTLEFRVEGKYLERFLNLSARARIPIWDGQREEHSFCGKTLQSNEEALKRSFRNGSCAFLHYFISVPTGTVPDPCGE